MLSCTGFVFQSWPMRGDESPSAMKKGGTHVDH